MVSLGRGLKAISEVIYFEESFGGVGVGVGEGSGREKMKRGWGNVIVRRGGEGRGFMDVSCMWRRSGWEKERERERERER